MLLQPIGTTRRASIVHRMDAAKRGLPAPAVQYHEAMTRRGRRSVVPLTGPSCGECHLRLPVATLASLRRPDRFAPCPHCGTYVWPGAGLAAAEVGGRLVAAR